VRCDEKNNYRQLNTDFSVQPGGSSSAGTACHVYVVDVEKARKAFAAFRETGNAGRHKVLSASQTTFPEFHPVIGEKGLPAKHFLSRAAS
jgi:hypothetical protein